MVCRALTMLALLLLINGCAFTGRQAKAVPDKPALMTDIYAQKDAERSIEKDLKQQKIFGYVKPYIPVIEGPVVRKVWVPDHRAQDDAAVLVGGHWVYLMVEGPKWFTQEQTSDVQMPVIVPGQPIGKERK